MNPQDEIAAILRDNLFYSHQTGSLLIHGAIEKLKDREILAERRSIAKGLFIALVIVVGCLILRKDKGVSPILSPEQQMEDTISITQKTTDIL